MSKRPSQSDLILAHFQKYPKQDLAHEDWIDEVSRQYEELTGRIPRDLWRAARKLYEAGTLIQVHKGVYRYDPDYVHTPELEDFTDQQKREILERDNFRCVICGRGQAEGIELHVDHIRPKSRGGKATINNGQTLCSQHNFIKKNLNATETGKRMFIRLYELATEEENREIIDFCREVLEVYEKHGINDHIDWIP